jgi:hypothetical protein
MGKGLSELSVIVYRLNDVRFGSSVVLSAIVVSLTPSRIRKAEPHLFCAGNPHKQTPTKSVGVLKMTKDLTEKR